MLRRNNRKLKIGWLIPTVGTFGAVREMVEVSNVLIGKGHNVVIYHPDGSECKWLKCLAQCRKLQSLNYDSLDVLIGIVDWKTDLYNNLLQAKAKVKAICLLGFEPTQEMAKALRGEEKFQDEAQRIIYDAMQRKFLLLADSSWQVEWIKTNTGYPAGPAFGGVNLDMFQPSEKQNKKLKIIYSGDPRDRKGTDIVEKSLEIIKNKTNYEFEAEFYWNKKLKQPELIKFIQQGDIFLDAHRRAGWCNPVAEAIACGVVPVCTDIGANRDFALHRETALIIPVDDAEAMADAAIELIESPELRNKLSKSGLKLINKFSYENIVPVLEQKLISLIYDQQNQ